MSRRLPAQADLVWAPPVAVMYPAGFATRIVPAGPATVGLEDAFRPHFFAGVATVVAKLLIQCQPDFAMFGEKDYQQLKVVTRMAKDLDLNDRRRADRARAGRPRAVVAQRLPVGERTGTAPTLYRVLKDCAAKIATGELVAPCSTKAGRDRGGRLRARLSRSPPRRDARADRRVADGPIRLLVAARIGKTRLIDNIAV